MSSADMYLFDRTMADVHCHVAMCHALAAFDSVNAA